MKETQFLQVQAYDHLIDAIKQGSLKTDEIYSLNQIAKNMGISKTPLRDAVLRLEQERYIDILPSKGFILHKMTREDIIETYELREALEVFCCKQLSRHLIEPEAQKYFEKLSGKIESQKEIMDTTQSSEDFARKDYEFHRSVVQYVSNESMLEIYRRFMYRIFWLNVTSFSKEGRMTDTVEEHIHFLDMIKAQDYKGIEDLLSHHLSIARDINLDILDKRE